MRMKSCPRCETEIDESARYCVQCGAPQTEAAADELEQYVQRQAEQLTAGSGAGGGGAGGGGGGSDDGGTLGAAAEQLSDREQLWRRGCYVVGYATVVVAITRLPNVDALPLFLGGVAILPPIRRLTAEPLGYPLTREVMVGLYAVFVLIGVALFVLL